jgi:hypothetical protein
VSDLPAGPPPVCPSCRRPDPECDCPVEYVNEYKPRLADRAAAAVDDDADDDAYGW